MLVRAWKAYRQTLNPKRETRDLVIVGNVGWKYEDVIEEIKALPHEAKYHMYLIRRASDETKRNFLLAADMVCVPSLDEGFGLVALEAQQANTRVISSNAGALPEVMGQNGVSLDPTDEKAWIEALSDQIDGATRQNINPEFFWDKAAEKVLLGLRKYGLPSVRRKKK
jgi:glycosyltransferase involved in cell wall biosynthesis